MQKRDSRVIVVMGDGEINEGSVWEAAMCAGKHRLSNLTAVIDYNKVQSAGPTREIQDLEPLADKWRAFNFATVEVDGHDVEALRARVPRACRSRRTGRPPIICHTVKGKGIGFAENDANWHHKSKIKPRTCRQALRRAGVSHAPDLSQHGLRARQARRARGVHRLRSQPRPARRT